MTSRILQESKNLKYIKDNKTDLCFAFLENISYDNIYTFTNVPCDKIPSDISLRGDNIYELPKK